MVAGAAARHHLVFQRGGCFSELHSAAGLDPDDYAPDQRALLAAHGLFWLERALAKPDGNGAYSAVEIYDALWLLYAEAAVARSELTPLLPRVIEQCKQYGTAWSDTSPLRSLTSVAEALIDAEEPSLRPWAKQALALVRDLAAPYSANERKALTTLLRQIRQRTGL